MHQANNGQNAHQQYQEVLELRMFLRLLPEFLDEFYIGKIHLPELAEIEKMDDNGD